MSSSYNYALHRIGRQQMKIIIAVVVVSLDLHLSLVKNQIQPSKFEDLIGFIKQFINWAASHLATRRVL